MAELLHYNETRDIDQGQGAPVCGKPAFDSANVRGHFDRVELNRWQQGGMQRIHGSHAKAALDEE